MVPGFFYYRRVPKLAPYEVRRQRILLENPNLEYVWGLLLFFGGDEVVAAKESDEEIDNLFERGFLQDGGDARMVRGDPCSCHSNTANQWSSNKRSRVIVTGYALSADGLWRQHSWLLNTKGRILETTVPRVLYFGYALSPYESRYFAVSNS